MTTLFNPSDFEVKEFYKYPTTVIYRIVEWDEGFHSGAPGLNEDVKDLFNELIEDTAKRLNRNLHDNKVAMKVIYKPTNTEMYIGYKDWNWSIGFGLNKYQTGEKIIL